MRGKNELRLITVFAIAFSLGILVGPSSGNVHLPTVPLARANPEPCVTLGSSGACSGSFWYPAGPAMNTELATIFTDATAEYSNLQSPSPSIDFTDSPIPNSLISSFDLNPNFLVTAPVAQTGYYEIQYMMAQNFWGCQFSFGDSACGVQIRQGIAHMMDKTSFTNNEVGIAGISTPIDNPVPTTSAGGLSSPNPCGYDASFPQSGPNCIVGAPGGTSYHLAAATGADGYPWLAAHGSADLNAAAQHFVNAGLATGFNSTTSVLTGINPAAASNPVRFFIRSDDTARLDLGQSLEAQVCYLFTGSYTVPCTYLDAILGPVTAFPGFTTSKTSLNLTWWIYTAAYSYVPFFDDSLYFTYNSRFVSGIPSIQPPNGPCSSLAVPTASAANYMYLCSPQYDTLSSQIESASSLAQAVTFGVQAEAYFGANAFTLPIFERNLQFGYLNNGWTRVINHNSAGLPNYFTWLNAWNPAPPVSGTIRQGLSQTTRSVNPYIASTVQDSYIVGNVYDSLYAANPLAPAQSINWMTVSTAQLSNSSLTYTAPAHTLTTYRFTLRHDLFFQDGRMVTAYDVAFSYLSLLGSGANFGTGAAPMTGVTVLGPSQFDIGVSSIGPFVLPNLTNLPIVPARYWTNSGSPAWDSATMTCTSNTSCSIGQYTLAGSTVNCALNCSPFSASLMTFNSVDVSATFDPIFAHTFLGSGPWTCGVVTSSGSGTCTPLGQENPPPGGGSYTLTRFGAGVTACQQSNCYFRSSSTTALWIWSGDNGDITHDFLNFAHIEACFNQPVSLTGTCGPLQQGIGNPGTGNRVSLSQVSVALRFFGVSWVAPFDWQTNPPLGISPFPPILYEGPVTLSPASIVGCPNGYDC